MALLAHTGADRGNSVGRVDVGSQTLLSDTDRSYLSHLELLYSLDDPYTTARSAMAEFRIFPVSFARSVTLWEPRPRDAQLADIYSNRNALLELSALKTVEWAFIIPGDSSTFVYGNNETAYINGYREALKAHTWAKSGVDCNRHLEIIASGAIPVFRSIQSVPAATMFAYPKHLMAFFEEFQNETSLARLHVWRHLMLKWGHTHLTAPAMVRYMANVSGVDLESPFQRIAFIDEDLLIEADYLAMSVLIGLIEWLGYDRVDVFYFPEYLVEGNNRTLQNGGRLYGGGFGYSNVLKRPRNSFRQFNDMLRSLENGEYAAVVWGSWPRSQAFFADKAMAAYANRPEALWLCDGEDSYLGWPHSETGKVLGVPLLDIATVFVRELHDTKI